MTFINFVNKERAKQAAALLHHTNLQIQQIASTVACDLPIEDEKASYKVLSVDQWGNV